MVKLLYSNKMASIEGMINENCEHSEFSNYLVQIKESTSTRYAVNPSVSLFPIEEVNYRINKIYRIYKKRIMTLKDLKIIPLTNSNDLRYFAIMEGKETQEREEIKYEKYKIISDDSLNSISKIIIEENGKEIIIENKEIIFERV